MPVGTRFLVTDNKHEHDDVISIVKVFDEVQSSKIIIITLHNEVSNLWLSNVSIFASYIMYHHRVEVPFPCFVKYWILVQTNHPDLKMIQGSFSQDCNQHQDRHPKTRKLFATW